MTQNRSSAVMQQRSEPHDSLDDFPTPPWATRALCEYLQNPADELLGGGAVGWTTGAMSCREPAANRGHMVRPLREYFAAVEASDIFDYGAGFPVQDYLFGPLPPMVEWTITNPPFKLAEQFIERALQTSRVGVAMIVRAAFLEGGGRYQRLFSATPPSHVLQFTERVVMHKGVLRDPNVAIQFIDPKTGKMKMRKPSTATAYCWLVWWLPLEATRLEWIAPCRKRLERPGDYSSEAA